MARPTVIERARLYIAAMPVGISGQGRHNATVAVANVLLHGFALDEPSAWVLLSEYNERCQPPSPPNKLEHRFGLAKVFKNDSPDGWLLEGDKNVERGEVGAAPVRSHTPLPKPEFDLERLCKFAGELTRRVDLVWLANRSAVDPATVDSQEFLNQLYRPGEKVLVFANDKSQGDAVWPDEKLPHRGPRGVWFLAQPVDGEYHPNPRSVKFGGEPKMSRRSEESVTHFRYMVIESDKAPTWEWLAALVQLPLRIAAIYTSGGRSVHALVQVDCRTKPEWDQEKRAMAGGLIILGADPGAMSAVRLTRLPGCWRAEKKAMQKLLYLQPSPQLRPLVEVPVVRDVEDYWLRLAEVGISDADDTGGAWLKKSLGYYATVRESLQRALEKLS